MTTHIHIPSRSAQAPRLLLRRHRTLAAAALAVFTLSAHGNTDTWTGDSGSWSLASNWSLGALPAAGDTVFLTQADATNRTVVLNKITPSLGELTIDATGPGKITLTNPSNSAPTLNVAGDQYVGLYGVGSVSLTSTGRNDIAGNLYLGFSSGSSGTYSKSWGGISAANVYIGGSSTAPGGAGSLSLSLAVGEVASVAGTVKIWDTPGTSLTLNGGIIRATTFDTSGNPNRFNWISGELALADPADFTPGPNNVGANVSLSTGYRILTLAGGLLLPSGTSLSLGTNGWLTASSINTAGNPNGFTWTTGNLTLTSPAGLSPDSTNIGTSLSLPSGKNLAVTNTLTLPVGTSLSLTGGRLSVGKLDTAGDPTRLSWSSGTLSVTGQAGLDAASLGPSTSLSSSKILSITNDLMLSPATSLAISSGSHTVGGTLSLQPTGTLSLTGGTLSVSSINIAPNPDGFNWSAGTLSITNSAEFNVTSLGPSPSVHPGAYLNVSNNLVTVPAGTSFQLGGSAHVGTLRLNGGSATVDGNLIYSRLDVGYSANSSFTQAGTVQYGGQGEVYVGYANGVTGSYTLLYGSLTVQGGVPAEYIGYSGTGSFTQTGGYNIVGSSGVGSLSLAYYTGSSASYTLSAGSLSSTSAYVGRYGTATLAQSGGSASFGSLYLAYGTGSSAYYSLSGTAAASAGATYLGGSSSASGGAATLAISGGTFSASSIKIWNDSSLLSLAGGTLITSSIDTNGNPNRFSFTSGTLTISSTNTFSLSSVGNLNIGPAQNLSIWSSLALPANSTLTLSGGSLSVSSSSEYVATTGSASINHSAGTNNVYSLSLAYNTAATGFYSLSGTGILTAGGGSEYVGGYGTGKFTQSGGTNVVTNGNLYLAYTTGSAGSYSLSGNGLITLANSAEYVGYSGTATFTQAGGINNVGGNALYLGYNSGSIGTYSLSGTGSINSRYQYLGYYGRGTFIQSGGSNSLTSSSLILAGFSASSFGSYSLSGTGLLSVAGGEIIGGVGTGSFTQSGGTSTATGVLSVGNVAGSTGSYVLSGGTASASNIYIGGSASTAGGTASLSITAGSLSTPGTLRIWNTTNTSVSLSGGSLSIGSLDTSSNPARFIWTGGTLAVTSSPLSISSSGPLGPSLILSPSMTLRVAQPMTIDPAATLSFAGGTLDLANTFLTWSYAATSPATTVRQQLLTGHLASSTLPPLTSLGYLDTGTTLLVKSTPQGDANLDGAVNADDYALLDRSFAMQLTSAHWTDGDFNYDGQITSADYLLIDTVVGQAQGFSPGFLAERQSQFGAPYVQELLASVPEPSSPLACLFAGSLLLVTVQATFRNSTMFGSSLPTTH